MEMISGLLFYAFWLAIFVVWGLIAHFCKVSLRWKIGGTCLLAVVPIAVTAMAIQEFCYDEPARNNLHNALVSGDLESVKRQVENGASVNGRYDFGPDDEEHSTPLIDAVDGGSLPVVRLLIEHGSDVNEATENTSPLQQAISNSRPDLALFLIAHGASVNMPRVADSAPLPSPLSVARKAGDARMIKLLKHAGAKD